MIGFALDVTDHRVLEEQMQRAQQVDSIGALAGGIAHDFNNVLTAISGFAHLALGEVEAGSAAEAHLQQVTQATRAGHGDDEPAPEVQPRRGARSTAAQPGCGRARRGVDAARDDRSAHPAGRGSRRRPAAGLAPIRIQLRRLLVNLAVNARDAMPAGGVLTIETRHAAGEGVVEIAIRDTGTGMDEEVRTRLFEPFFTTKPVGKGTGLGLAVVQTIVRQCGGWIEVDTEPGRGTTFSIGLPTAEAA